MPDDPLKVVRQKYERWQREKPPSANTFSCADCRDIGLMWVKRPNGIWQATPCHKCAKGLRRGFDPSRHPEGAMTWSQREDADRKSRKR